MTTLATTDPWRVDPAEYPAAADENRQLRFLLRWAVLAPSAHNTQPWRVRVADGQVELHADPSRALPVADPDGRERIISCGAALFFLRLAIRRFGRMDRVALFPDPSRPDHLATVRRAEPVTPGREVHRLFEAVTERRTQRAPFAALEVRAADVAALLEAAEDEGAWFRPLGGALRGEVAGMIQEADLVQYADSAFRHELAAWVRPRSATSHDGIPARALGLPRLLAPLAPTLMGALNLGPVRGGSDRRAAEEAPLLAVLGTEGDRPADWLNAGQAVARVLLAGRARGLSAGFLNPPVQVPALRQALRERLGREGWPQLVLRMGHGRVLRPTPRRGVEECVTG